MSQNRSLSGGAKSTLDRTPTSPERVGTPISSARSHSQASQSSTNHFISLSRLKNYMPKGLSALESRRRSQEARVSLDVDHQLGQSKQQSGTRFDQESVFELRCLSYNVIIPQTKERIYFSEVREMRKKTLPTLAKQLTF